MSTATVDARAAARQRIADRRAVPVADENAILERQSWPRRESRPGVGARARVSGLATRRHFRRIGATHPRIKTLESAAKRSLFAIFTVYASDAATFLRSASRPCRGWRKGLRSPPFDHEKETFHGHQIGINGFGRIGRAIVRILNERGSKNIELVAINDLTDAKTLAHLYNFDTVHGRAPHPAEAHENTLRFANGEVKVFAEKEPGKIPWKSLGVDVVLECTGLFTDKEKAEAHIHGGAKKF